MKNPKTIEVFVINSCVSLTPKDVMIKHEVKCLNKNCLSKTFISYATVHVGAEGTCKVIFCLNYWNENRKEWLRGYSEMSLGLLLSSVQFCMCHW